MMESDKLKYILRYLPVYGLILYSSFAFCNIRSNKDYLEAVQSDP